MFCLQGIQKTQLTTSQTFYGYRRLDAIDIDIDCHCVGGCTDADFDFDFDFDCDCDSNSDDDDDNVVGLVRKRADNFLLSTRNDHGIFMPNSNWRHTNKCQAVQQQPQQQPQQQQ
ncbi:GH20296 [Drosophila grimshawi]|uniref:GH20296 n=1 Tax=Drosophila grimshawi TaxID=7222 RepID=B4J527_DROGR|nr:GH20296 [Drosophila grimshawi]